MEDFGSVNEQFNPSGPDMDSNWVDALRAATEVARRAATSEIDVLRAVSEELQSMQLIGSTALLTDVGKLAIRSRFLSGSAEEGLRRLTGLEISGYEFDPSEVPAYQAVLESGNAKYYPERTEILKAMTPDRFKPLVPVILRIVGGNQPMILAPMIINERPIGTLNVTAKWLKPEHVPIMEALADFVAISLQQVRSRKQIEHSLQRERLRNQVAQTLASPNDLPDVLERVIQLAVEITGADAGAFALIQEDGETITYPFVYGLPESLKFQPSPKGQGIAWHLIESGNALLLEEYELHERSLSAWSEAGLHAFLGVPLYVGDEPVGALGLFKKRRGDSFQPEQLELTQSIANMAAIGIKNAQLFREVQRSAEESRALIETSSSVSASLDLDTVLRMIAEQAKRLLAADGSRIHMIDPSDNLLRTLVAQDPHAEAMMSMELDPTDGLAGYVLQSGQAMIVNDPNQDPRGKHVPGTPEDEPECLALAPLNIRHRPMGVMAVRRFGKDRPFQPSDMRLLTAFASQAAIAIENADLYGQIERQAQLLEKEVVARTRDLAKSEARYRGLVETSLTGILQIDYNGTIGYANQVFAELIDYPQDQIQGMPIREAADLFLPEDSRDLVLSRFEARLAGKRPASEVYEVEFKRQSGRRVPTIFAVNRITDDDGTIQGITCLVLDISARKSLETALRSERDRLEAILSNIGDAVVVTDPKGNIEYVNPAWERLNGYSRSEALGMNLRQLSDDANSNKDHEEMLARIEAGRSWSGELVSRRKDGSSFDASVTGTPIHGDDGEVVNFVTVQHDISALKEVDRLKSQFVSDVSHELRTPLTNIRLYVDLLAEKSNAERADDYLTTLNRESERLAHLIDDLLSLSRLEAGSAPFEPRPIDINELLDNLSEDRRALAAEQNLQLEVEPKEGLPPVMGDARLISQIFTNLLTNAMNYTLEGGHITLRTDMVKKDGQSWMVAEVEDTGLGIDPDEKPQIFERFFRGKASQQTGAPGTGLGLAICREIAELHGGHIHLQSQKGQGTLVSVWLPLGERGGNQDKGEIDPQRATEVSSD